MKKQGRKIITILAAVAMISSSISVFAGTKNTDDTYTSSGSKVSNEADKDADASDESEQNAEEKIDKIYIFWDKENGDDEAEGYDIQNAVLTIEKAAELYEEAFESLNDEAENESEDSDKEDLDSSLKDGESAETESSKLKALKEKYKLNNLGSGPDESTQKADTSEDGVDEEEAEEEKSYDSPVYIVMCSDEELSEEEEEFISDNLLYTLTFSEYEELIATEIENEGENDTETDSDVATENDMISDEKTDSDEAGSDITAVESESAANILENADLKDDSDDGAAEATDESEAQDEAESAEQIEVERAQLSLFAQAPVSSVENDTETASVENNTETASLSQEAEGESESTMQIIAEVVSIEEKNSPSLLSLPGSDLVGTGTTNRQGASNTNSSSSGSSSSGAITMIADSVQTGDSSFIIPFALCLGFMLASYIIYRYMNIERARAMRSEAHEGEMQKFRKACSID